MFVGYLIASRFQQITNASDVSRNTQLTKTEYVSLLIHIAKLEIIWIFASNASKATKSDRMGNALPLK